MIEPHDVFLSYSRNDLEPATLLRDQLEKAGLNVFRDEDSIRASDLWLAELQAALDACASFVVLVGRDGVRRWVGAETEVALIRHFGPHHDPERLPIYPVLLDDASPEALPPFLRLFQSTPWTGADLLPDRLVEHIRERVSPSGDILPVGDCPFVGLDAYGPKQAHLFFGRHRETLDALARFDTQPGHPDRPRGADGRQIIRWLEITGNSGSGKSSLMNAGLLPLIDRGFLWARTGFEHWRRIGPMMPGERPVLMLAEHLARAFGEEMADVRRRLEEDDERALADWLRGRKPDDDTAFLLALDQFEELFTVADPAERSHFDRLLATALADPECPLFVLSTVRSDFLDRYDVLVPRLVDVRNRLSKLWTLPRIGARGLREIIDGPARLARLNANEVKELMVADLQDEPGALPLVENALTWLWEQRAGNRLSGRLYNEQGGAAGILSRNADSVLEGLGDQREQALELLLCLVNVDPEGRRHTRQRVSLAEALEVAGGGEDSLRLIHHLAGQTVRTGGQPRGGLRLITITQDAEETAPDGKRWVNLIHETLIRAKEAEVGGEPAPYWPTLWQHIEQNRAAAVRRARTRLRALEIEDAAAAWDRSGRDESLRWPDAEVQETLRDIRRSGLALHEVIRPGLASCFFGPVQTDEIVDLLALDEAADQERGSGRYGERWRLPLSHQARADLGNRLGESGDYRDGVGLRDGLPGIDWGEIEGKEVAIEEDLKRPISRTVSPFWMARYPITIDQFDAFVRDCYRDGRWHLAGFPVDFLEQEPPVHRARYGNHPADSVSWYDAMAFCHWLSSRTGVDIRLPDEFEWQLAATGGEPDRVYPWGSEWDPKREPWRANTAESGLDRSTAVGMYPHGASRTGVRDLAGTIWEWCLNEHDKPDETEVRLEDQNPRVLRSGSWNYNQNLARCAYRSRGVPYYRSFFIGFRVVCSSPIMNR